jgi:hypothetical protein
MLNRRRAALAGLLVAALATSLPAAEAGAVALFDGKDLDGWDSFLVEPGTKTADVWSVHDGVLVCKGKPQGYLFTKRQYTSYALVVEWRWAPGTEPGNSGVLMRLNGEPKAIPRAFEAQLKSGDAGDLFGFWGMKLDGDEGRKRSTTGSEMVGDMVGVVKMEPAEKSPGEWNRYEIRLEGPRCTVHVNGKKVNEAWDMDVVAGAIGLQSEGGEIQFRKVELTPIP